MKCNYNREKIKPMSKRDRQLLDRELARIMMEVILPKQKADERSLAKQEERKSNDEQRA